MNKPVVEEKKEGFRIKKGMRIIINFYPTFDELKTAAAAIKDAEDRADADFAITRWESAHKQSTKKAFA